MTAETGYRWVHFASTLLMIVPPLVVCIVGLFIGLRRRDLGKRAQHGIGGFALLIGSLLIACLLSWFGAFVFATDAENFERYAKFTSKLGLISMGLQTAGFILLLLAVFHRDQSKPPVIPGHIPADDRRNQ